MTIREYCNKTIVRDFDVKPAYVISDKEQVNELECDGMKDLLDRFGDLELRAMEIVFADKPVLNFICNDL